MVALDEKTLEFLNHKKPGTRKIYIAGLKAFQQFYSPQGTVPDFLDRLQLDRAQNWREAKNVATNTVADFILWLKPKYARKSVRSYVASLQSLARYYKLDFSAADAQLPAPNPDPCNKKHIWTLSDVAKFVSTLPSPLYQSLAVVFFQSGLDCQTTLTLKYSDIQKELEAGIVPICLDVERAKTQTPFVTCIGALGVRYLTTYLAGRGKLEGSDLLFPVTEQAIDDCFRRYAEKFLGRRIEHGKRNPCTPHSLRTGFRTLMRRAGCPEEFVEYFMGHDLSGDLRKTYTNMSHDDWRQEYEKYEKAVSFNEA